MSAGDLPRSHSDLSSFTRKVLIAVAITATTAVVLGLTWILKKVLIVVFGGALLAVFLTHVSNRVGRRFHLRKGVALLSAILVILLLLAIGLWLLAPHAIQQSSQLVNEMQKALNQLIAQVQHTSWGQNLLKEGPQNREITSGLKEVLSRVPKILSATIWVVGSIALLLFVGLYGSIQSRLFYGAMLKLLPPNRRRRGREVLDAMGETLYWWLLGRFVSMLIIGTFTTIGLYFLDIPMAISLGLLAGLLTFIPNIGPIISVIPAVLIGVTLSITKVLYVLVLYIVVQTLESYFITPMVQKQAIQMPPALILTVQVCGGLLLGALGLLLATPLTALAIVLVRMIYVEDVLGDTPNLPSKEGP